jgi:hypothetical protein
MLAQATRAGCKSFNPMKKRIVLILALCLSIVLLCPFIAHAQGTAVRSSSGLATNLAVYSTLTIRQGGVVNTYFSSGAFLRSNTLPPFDWEFHNTNGVRTEGTNAVTKRTFFLNGDITLPQVNGGTIVGQTLNFSQNALIGGNILLGSAIPAAGKTNMIFVNSSGFFQTNDFATFVASILSSAGLSPAQFTAGLASGTNAGFFTMGTFSDQVNLGDTSGALGSITFSPGPANAWLDWNFISNGVPLHLNVPGTIYSKFNGDGSLITSLSASEIGGTLPLATLPTSVVTNGSGGALTGLVKGDGFGGIIPAVAGVDVLTPATTPPSTNYARNAGPSHSGWVPISTGTNDSYGSEVFTNGPMTGGGGGSQTPLLQDVDGAKFGLLDISSLRFTNGVAAKPTLTLSLNAQVYGPVLTFGFGGTNGLDSGVPTGLQADYFLSDAGIISRGIGIFTNTSNHGATTIESNKITTGTVTADTISVSTFTAATTWQTNVVTPTNSFAGTVLDVSKTDNGVTNLSGDFTFTGVSGITLGGLNSAFVDFFAGASARTIDVGDASMHKETNWNTSLPAGWEMIVMAWVRPGIRTNFLQIIIP